MHKSLTSIFFLFLAFGTISLHSQNSIESEIISLDNDEMKRNYLRNIMGSDQGLRKTELKEVIKKYGENSKEYTAIFELINKRDSVNQIKIDLYLKHHGYPSKIKLGHIPSITPLIVVHHSNSTDYRRKHFKVLKKALENKDIDEVAFAMYLGRFYKLEFGNRPESDRFDSKHEEIEFLIKELKL